MSEPISFVCQKKSQNGFVHNMRHRLVQNFNKLFQINTNEIRIFLFVLIKTLVMYFFAI
jgi:hypothetical protein